MAEKKLTYSQKIALNQSLAKQGQSANYDRAVLLTDVYEDQEFLAMCRATEKDAVELLDDECGDLCCSFMQLKAVLERFPKKEQWETQKLHDMLAIVIAERSTAERDRSAPRPSWKQKYEELEKKFAAIERELNQVRAAKAELENLLSRTFQAGR